jgi:diketogulonate reductase-like aldo/keto reductase
MTRIQTTRIQTTRRHLLAGACASVGLATLPAWARASIQPDSAMRPIPSTGQMIPMVGLGSWITFNVGQNPDLLEQSTNVIAAFVEAGGGMIDSSPMYGSSQQTIGHALSELGPDNVIFSADKVWTSEVGEGPGQIEATRSAWGVPRFDLLQVHNLVGWEAHLETLFAMKAEGQLGYVGITTSHGRRHGLLEQVMKRYPLDFVQLTYNVLDRAAEDRLLPLAQDRGIGVIVNRPYRRGQLFRHFAGKSMPGWAPEIGAASWAQILLKFVLSHRAVTVAIPATRNVAHLYENKQAALGPWPDAAMRQRMADDLANL